MTPRVIVCLLAGSLFLAGTADATFMDKRVRKGGFGIKGGLIGQTTVSVDNHHYNNRVAVSGGVFFELPLIHPLMLGISGDIYNISFQGLEDNEPFLDIGIGPKYLAVMEAAGIVLKPGFNLGFGYLGPVAPRKDSLGVTRYRIDATSDMTWRISTEALFLTRMRHAYLLELALVGTAFGGNADVDVTTNPVFLLRVGIMY
jgi:hypothetical protein